LQPGILPISTQTSTHSLQQPVQVPNLCHTMQSFWRLRASTGRQQSSWKLSKLKPQEALVSFAEFRLLIRTSNEVVNATAAHDKSRAAQSIRRQVFAQRSALVRYFCKTFSNSAATADLQLIQAVQAGKFCCRQLHCALAMLDASVSHVEIDCFQSCS